MVRLYFTMMLLCNEDESINWEPLCRLVDRQNEDGVCTSAAAVLPVKACWWPFDELDEADMRSDGYVLS